MVGSVFVSRSRKLAKTHAETQATHKLKEIQFFRITILHIGISVQVGCHVCPLHSDTKQNKVADRGNSRTGGNTDVPRKSCI